MHGFAIFRVKIGVKDRNFDFYEVKIGPKFLPLTPFLTIKKTKLCKSDITSKFLDLESYSGENYIKIREKKFRTKYDLK